MGQTANRTAELTELIVNTVVGPLVVLGADMTVVFANRAFLETFLAEGAAPTGESFWAMAGRCWDTPALRQLLEGGPAEPSAVREQTIELEHPSLGRETLRLTARWAQLAGDDAALVLLSLRDDTAQAKGAAGVASDSAAQHRRHEELERRVQERTHALEEQKRTALELAQTAEMARLDAVQTAAALQRSDLQLRQSQKMEAFGQLAGGIAHDFNNLLTAIVGFSDLAVAGVDPSDHSTLSDLMEVQKAAQRATNLTAQLLAFSRKRTIEPKVLDPNRELGALQQLLARLLSEDIELITHLDTEVGCIRIDPTALEQVVINLAVNARDAMPHGGQLVVETASVTLNEAHSAAKGTFIQPGDYVTLTLSDTGLGMDETTVQHVFEPFFTTKEVGKGTGLGLSVVYGIVKQAGGFVWAYSELGKGTTFRLYFPKHAAPTTEVQNVVHQPAEGGAETILVVEDDEQIRSLCVRALSPLGYHILVAGNGGEALQLCDREQRTIDLLLTDVVMPRMSGKQLALRLGQTRPAMKILFMSGYTRSAIVHHGVVDQGVALLEKPFTPYDVARKVRQVLDADAFFGREFLNRKPSLLLVADNAATREQACSLLGASYDVVLATTGQEALERIKLSPPEVVICVCSDAGLGCPELFNTVFALNPHLAEHFLFAATPSDVERMTLSPAMQRRVVSHPFDKDELLGAVAAVLAGELDGGFGSSPPLPTP